MSKADSVLRFCLNQWPYFLFGGPDDSAPSPMLPRLANLIEAGSKDLAKLPKYKVFRDQWRGTIKNDQFIDALFTNYYAITRNRGVTPVESTWQAAIDKFGTLHQSFSEGSESLLDIILVKNLKSSNSEAQEAMEKFVSQFARLLFDVSRFVDRHPSLPPKSGRKRQFRRDCTLCILDILRHKISMDREDLAEDLSAAFEHQISGKMIERATSNMGELAKRGS